MAVWFSFSRSLFALCNRTKDSHLQYHCVNSNEIARKFMIILWLGFNSTLTVSLLTRIFGWNSVSAHQHLLQSNEISALIRSGVRRQTDWKLDGCKYVHFVRSLTSTRSHCYEQENKRWIWCDAIFIILFKTSPKNLHIRSIAIRVLAIVDRYSRTKIDCTCMRFDNVCLLTDLDHTKPLSVPWIRLSSALDQRKIVATFASIADRISTNATLRLLYELQSRT